MRISDWSSDVCSSDLGGKDDVVPASSSEELLEAASGPAAFISMKDWTHKPVMQKLGPWISHAIETMRGGKVDMLPELLKGWSLAGSHPQCQDCMNCCMQARKECRWLPDPLWRGPMGDKQVRRRRHRK